MEENISIQVGENEYLNLKDPQEKFRALTWILINGDKPFISRYILNPSNDIGFDELEASDGYNRNKLISEIRDFFNLFYKSETNNFLSEYLLDYNGESDGIKKLRLNQLLKGLLISIEFNWEHGASFVFLALRDKDFSFVKQGNLEELLWYHYLVWQNLKGIYDLIWDYYSGFIEKDQFSFSHFYSHKEKPIKEKEQQYTSSYPEIIDKLVEKSKMDTYDNYQTRLIRKEFLSEDGTQWLKNTADLIRYYNHCCRKKIFNRPYIDTTKGLNMLRQIYNFNKGLDMGKTKQRRLLQDQTQEYGANQFDFLD